MSATTSGSGDVGARTQQPMLASQRAAEAAPRAQNVGRFAQYFPLGYKEAFNQWVCHAYTPLFI